MKATRKYTKTGEKFTHVSVKFRITIRSLAIAALTLEPNEATVKTIEQALRYKLSDHGENWLEYGDEYSNEKELWANTGNYQDAIEVVIEKIKPLFPTFN